MDLSPAEIVDEALELAEGCALVAKEAEEREAATKVELQKLANELQEARRSPAAPQITLQKVASATPRELTLIKQAGTVLAQRGFIESSRVDEFCKGLQNEDKSGVLHALVKLASNAVLSDDVTDSEEVVTDDDDADPPVPEHLNDTDKVWYREMQTAGLK